MTPFVSIILPIRNEAAYITNALASVLAQNYPPESMEVLIVDGQSTDGTRAAIEELVESSNFLASFEILDNPGRIVPTGMNIALQKARGDIIIRVDGHCIIAPDYVSNCVSHLQNDGAHGVGGSMLSIGETYIAEATAIGMSSPFGVGNSAFRTTAGSNMLVDTVPFPAYTRQIIQRAGLYDEELVRNQDDEYNYRIREMGGKILLAEDVHSTYFSRVSLEGLWRQYFQYGFWKVRVLQKHPRQMSLRQFVPPLFVFALLASLILAVLSAIGQPFARIQPAMLLITACIAPALYLAVNLLASILSSAKKGWQFLPLLPLVFAILHLGYGLGFLRGLMAFSRRWRDRQGGVPGGTSGHANGKVQPPVKICFRKAIHSFKSKFPRRLSLLFKRLFDILASLMGMLLLLPFLGLVAWKMRRESPGPIFFRGLRMGRNERPFKILKFRTMYEQAAGQNGPRITAQDDSRITPMGRWLRDTKLNELPQLWNVFKGEMSIVGPRPEDVDIARAWPDGVREEVLSVRPGITSPASVIYRDEEKLLHAANVMDEYLQTVLPQKLRLDQLYVRNRNFLGDLDVILATLASLLPQLRASQFSAEVLFNGHLSRLMRRYVSWYMIDSLVAFGAISASALLWRIERPLDLGWVHSGLIGGAMALIFSLVNSLRGLGSLSWQSARPAYAFDIFLSSALTTTLLAAINWFWIDRPIFPRGMVFVAGLLAFLGFLLVRYRDRLLTGLAWRWLSHRERESVLGERVLIVGAGDCGMLAHWLLAHSRLSNIFSIIGLVDDNPSKAGMTVDGLPVLGMTRRIPELVSKKDIGVILFAIESIHPEERSRILEICRSTRARLVMVPDLMQMFRERMVRDDAGHAVPQSAHSGAGTSGPAPVLRELSAVRRDYPEAV